MEGQNNPKQQQIEITKVPQKRTRKNKADVNKASKSSHYTRRRQQPDSSQQNLLPQSIPKTNGKQSVITQGHQNQLAKALIRIPYEMFTQQKFVSFNTILVQGTQIIIKIQKQNDNVIISTRMPQINRKMQVQEQRIEKKSGISQKIQQISDSIQQIPMIKYVVNIWGKYVYLSKFDMQNKVIKKVRKQINSLQDGEIIKFKSKEINSDLFVYLNLRAQEFITQDFNGLINQGNTCYMNSYLQTLYHIPAFRNLVYEAQIQDQNKFPATLQQLFFNLATSQKSVSAEALVKSFGWGKKQASIQQDAQEFSCLFFQVLQRKLNQSAPKNGYTHRTIQKLFKGLLIHYIQCQHVDFRRENYEQFIDLQLPIYPTLTQSLYAYTSQATMQGENKYRTQQYGQQQARKGVKISQFPPILMIQLKRFQYSFQQSKNIKILTQLQYEQFFDFSPWSYDQQSFKQEYELYAVLVHQGARAQSGHYYNFIKSDGKWYKFNDQIVQQVPPQKVFKYNFGGHHESIQFDAKEMKVQKKFVESKTTAYMLVYIKCSMKDYIMNMDNKYPEWIELKQSDKISKQQQRKNRKKFFHNVGILDWQTKLLGQQASEIGFLDPTILQKKKDIIQKIPKASKISDWLVQQKLVQQPKINEEKINKKNNKKPSKMSKNIKNQEGSKISKDLNNQISNNQLGIYVYFVTPQRQNLIGFCHKPHHTMEDLLKIGTDPYIFKAPFQVRKQQYITIIKKYKVQRLQDGTLYSSIIYDNIVPVSKEILYPDLLSILIEKTENRSQQNIVKHEQVQINGNQLMNGNKQKQVIRNYYIDDWKLGPININGYTGSVPLPILGKNQLLVCVVEQICCNLSDSQQEDYSFPKWYKNKKQTISLWISQQKTCQFNQQLLQIHNKTSLNQLRKIIFQLVKEKRPELLSQQNIVLKARLKKNSKVMYEAAEPDQNTVKDITKYQQRIQFYFSNLTVQSRQSQYQLEFYYRFNNLYFSDPIRIVVNKQQESIHLVHRIKHHELIREYMQRQQFKPDDAQILLFSKDRKCINDYVNNQGKVIHKGDLDAVLKKQKNSVLVVQGRKLFQMEKQPIIQIKDEDVQSTVNILLHHVSQSIQRVGRPRYFKVDRRMEFIELKNKVLDIIKNEEYEWEGKIVACNPFKTRIRLFAKDNKKVVQLNEYQEELDIKKLRIQDKTKLRLPSSRKSSIISNDGQQRIQQNEQKKEKREKREQVNGNKQGTNIEIEEIEQDKNGLEQRDNQKQQQIVNDEIPEQAEVTNVSGSQSTIYSMFPKIKVLKLQIIHNQLIKPNIALRLNVDF